MADTQISLLTAASAIGGSEQLPVVQAASTKVATVTQIATYLAGATQSLTNKKLGSLTTNGFVKTSAGDGTLSVDTSTYITGNQTITLSGDLSGSGTTAITAAIGTNKVANTQLAQMAASSFKGNNTGATANAADLTVAQAKTLLAITTSDVSGFTSAAAAAAPVQSVATLTGAITASGLKTQLAITSSDLSDFNSASRAQVEAELVAGTNVTITGSGTGATRQLTISASGSGGSGTKTLIVFTPLHNQPPASNFATLDTRNSIAVLDFDDTTNESAVFCGVIPQGTTFSSGILAHINWMTLSGTSGNVKWGVQFEKMNTNETSDSFDTATTGFTACNATTGFCSVTSITCTTIDSLVAGDFFRVKIYRDAADTTNDTVTGDAQFVALEIQAA